MAGAENAGANGNGAGGVAVAGERTAVADVRDALAGLGYSADEIRVATAELDADGAGDASVLLRAALGRLAVHRA